MLIIEWGIFVDEGPMDSIEDIINKKIKFPKDGCMYYHPEHDYWIEEEYYPFKTQEEAKRHMGRANTCRKKFNLTKLKYGKCRIKPRILGSDRDQKTTE